ncbi:hypothetical protein T492DRAFT_881896 [Pavlovales sp. CCMP2436]|nr:hypothetical protein T492DRAFT_881896 [Pavlovales sp. CCMP2436]
MAAAKLLVPAAAAQSPVTEQKVEPPSTAAIADALELYVAVAAGSFDALAKGTPSSSTDENGCTAAMVAAEFGHVVLLEVFAVATFEEAHTVVGAVGSDPGGSALDIEGESYRITRNAPPSQALAPQARRLRRRSRRA